MIHAIPGRLRLRLRGQAAIDRVECALRAHPGVLAVAWSAQTRSLVIHYRPGELAKQSIIETVAARAGLAGGRRPGSPSGPRRAGAVALLRAVAVELVASGMELADLLPSLVARALYSVEDIFEGARASRKGPAASP